MDASQPHRVLLTADTIGGVWHYAVELARALSAHGIGTALAAMGPPATHAQRAELARLPSLSFYERNLKLEWMDEPWRDVAEAGQWLLDLERALSPDVVHLNQFAFGALPFSAPTLTVAHSCVLSWWWAVYGEPAPPAWDRYRQCVRNGLNSADLVVAPTSAMLQSLRRHYSFSGDGLVIANARDADRFSRAAKKPFVLTAGRLWDKAKNLDMLERVAAHIRWPIIVAGPTIHPDGGSRATSNVHALGDLPTDALARHLARAAIYALPARYEPFGLSILEAGLSGCALVLGDIESLREVWGDAALFVPPNDESALRYALQSLIDDSTLREHLARSARNRALKYNPACMASAYRNAYTRIIERRRKSGAGAQRSKERACAS